MTLRLSRIPHGYRQPSRGILDDFEGTEEALEALVVGLDLRLAAETGRQLGLADAEDLQQGQQEVGKETDPRAMPGQVFGQDGFEFQEAAALAYAIATPRALSKVAGARCVLRPNR